MTNTTAGSDTCPTCGSDKPEVMYHPCSRAEWIRGKKAADPCHDHPATPDVDEARHPLSDLSDYVRSLRERAETAEAALATANAALEEAEHRAYPPPCGEGCDACPVPNDCPLDHDLKDCVNDRINAARERMEAVVEARSAALETLLARLRDYHDGQSTHTVTRLGMAETYADRIMQGHSPQDAYTLMARYWQCAGGVLPEWWRLETPRLAALEAEKEGTDA